MFFACRNCNKFWSHRRNSHPLVHFLIIINSDESFFKTTFSHFQAKLKLQKAPAGAFKCPSEQNFSSTRNFNYSLFSINWKEKFFNDVGFPIADTKTVHKRDCLHYSIIQECLSWAEWIRFHPKHKSNCNNISENFARLQEKNRVKEAK